MENPIILILYFFESFIVAKMGGVLFDISPRPILPFIKFGLAQSVSVYLVRNIFINFHLPLGLHTIVTFVFFMILLKFIVKIEWLSAAVISVFGYFIIISNEIITLSFYLKLLNYTPAVISYSPAKHLIYGFCVDLTYLLLTLIFLFLKRKKYGSN